MLLGAFLNWSFTANIISKLLNKVTEKPFTDVRTLVQNTDYLISVYPSSAQEDRFKLSTDHYNQLAYTERIKPYLEDFAKSYGGIYQFIHLIFVKNTFLLKYYFSIGVKPWEYNTVIPIRNPRYALLTNEPNAK